MTPSHLSSEQARRLYDRIGRWQDTQALYENRALGELIAHADFGEARAVLEFGCGTGRFAARLLACELPDDSRYLGVDVSPVMVDLATKRLRPWRGRAEVRLTDGAMQIPSADAAFDRFVADYVLDLLSPDVARELLAEARRLLEPGGLVCLVGLSATASGFPALVVRAWERVWRLSPHLVGGCRPIDATAYLGPGEWELVHHGCVSALGIPSDVIVARRRR